MRDDQEGNEDQKSRYGGLDYVLGGLVLITSFITSGVGTQKTANQNQDTSHQEIAKWTRVVGKWTRGLVVVGVLTAAVLALQLCVLYQTDKTTREALIAANRAWVGPIATTMSNPVKDQPLTITVQYRNTGRQPAFNVIAFHASSAYSLVDWENGKAAKEIEANKDSCLKFDAVSDIQVVYPSEGTAYSTSTFKTDAKGVIPYVVTDDLIAGRQIFATQGCFAYKSLGEVHHSAFCNYYQANTTPSPSSMSVCNIGNDAN